MPTAPCYISSSVSQGSRTVPTTRLFCIHLPRSAGRARRDFPSYSLGREALQTPKLLTCVCLGKLSCRAIPGRNAFQQWERFTPRQNSQGESSLVVHLRLGTQHMYLGGEESGKKKSCFQYNFGIEKCFSFIFKYSSSLSYE